ncbi:ABC-F family ATP-binding cassette domain-containing protein [Spiroplasma endosymbiont of Virgichneumon dumeticola]|uniref:ABC-F family ATP-binding cassette domain-containing protein n=1 Tax=Spiroplasma endosymbiont of Virgichneumon dumeticola TaxID=3139323 RepID=UPI0035C90535
MSIITIENLTHANGGKTLYKNASLQVNKGEHVALVGMNGVGKTTLLNIINGTLSADNIDLNIHPKIKIGYLDQHQEVNLELTVLQYLRESYQHLFTREQQMEDLYAKMAEEYTEELLNKAMKIQDELTNQGFDTISKKIGRLVDGLGINVQLLEQTLGSLSGGQRAKVLLAKLLLNEDDFLLLDEPTNFLDIEQINWLAKFLQTYHSAFLLVSHDRNFINMTCNIIFDIDNCMITRYVGNFESFLEQKSLHHRQYESAYTNQKKLIEKLETYISKNAARASTAKSAESRRKQLAKMDVMDKQQIQAPPKFYFKYYKTPSLIAVQAEKLEIGYDKPLIKPLTFTIRTGSKWVVKGYNGIGKTTFLQTLAGNISAISGKINLGDKMQVAYFHQTEVMSNVTPFNYLKELDIKLSDGEVRKLLANFGLRSNLVMKPMNLLSGGEQTKVRLAALALKPCNLLILDEPTNHIDVLAKDSLLKALQNFEGTVLITTHDTNFNNSWIDGVLDFEQLIE